jgi:hypothetical protein
MSPARSRISLLLLSLVAVAGCKSPPPLTGSQQHDAVLSRHRAALKRIARLGGKVFPETQAGAVTLHHADTATTDAVLDAADELIDLGSLSLIDAPPSPGWVERFAGEPHLRYIAISGAAVSQADIEALRFLPALRALHLIDVPLSDADVARLVLSAPYLTDLTLAGGQISDEGAAWLTELKSLRNLRLTRTRISHGQIARLLTRNPWLIVEVAEENVAYKGAWSGR